MYRSLTIAAAAVLVSSMAFAQMSSPPSATPARPGASSGTTGSGAGSAGTQSRSQQEQACRAKTNEAEKTKCLNDLQAAGPTSGSTSTGSAPPARSTTGSGTGTGTTR